MIFIEPIVLFGLFEDTSRQASDLGINALKVLGWFIGGFVFMWLAIWIGYKSTFGRPCPEPVRKIATWGNAVIWALIAALILFTTGSGTGPGTGTGPSGDGDQQQPTTDPRSGPREEPTPREKPETPSDRDESLKGDGRIDVVILGGVNEPQDRYYRLGNDPERITLVELKDRLRTLQQDESKPLKGIVIVFENDILRSDHPLVTLLKKWARETAGLAVTEPKAGEQIRPRS